MALVSEIIKDAFREANLIPITQSPTANEQDEALRLLNRFVRSVFGNEVGEKLQSYSIGDNNVISDDLPFVFDFTTPYYVPLNARLVANLTASTTINLNPEPEDGSRVAIVDVSGNFSVFPLTIKGNGRQIDSATSAVLSTDYINKEWFYRADIGSWMLVTDLTLEDTFPFPTEFEDMFVIGLALRLNPRNGASVDDQSMLNFRRQRNLFRSRYAQKSEQLSEIGLVWLSGSGYSGFSRR